MPDCTELQNAVDASLAIVDGLLTQLDGELIILQDRLMALDECLMGGFLTGETRGGEKLQGLMLHSYNHATRLQKIYGALLKDEGTHPAIDDGGAGPAPDGGGAA